MARMKQLSLLDEEVIQLPANVEVIFTMYLLDSEITRPLQDTSWNNIITFVSTSINNDVEVEIHFKLKS